MFRCHDVSVGIWLCHLLLPGRLTDTPTRRAPIPRSRRAGRLRAGTARGGAGVPGEDHLPSGRGCGRRQVQLGSSHGKLHRHRRLTTGRISCAVRHCSRAAERAYTWVFGSAQALNRLYFYCILVRFQYREQLLLILFVLSSYCNLVQIRITRM